jgi:hypothetical protein
MRVVQAIALSSKQFPAFVNTETGAIHVTADDEANPADFGEPGRYVELPCKEWLRSSSATIPTNLLFSLAPRLGWEQSDFRALMEALMALRDWCSEHKFQLVFG